MLKAPTIVVEASSFVAYHAFALAVGISRNIVAWLTTKAPTKDLNIPADLISSYSGEPGARS